MSADQEEADRYDGTPHPRHARQLIGFSDIERQLLATYREGRLPHAIMLGGNEGIGKATLAWRLTRFLCAHPRPDRDDAVSKACGLGLDLSVAAVAKAAAEVASLSHPDVALLRREVNERTGRFFTEIRTEDVRRVIGLFQRQAGAGGYRICIVDSAEDLNRSSANALLKLIEEPPPLSLFLIVAHRPGLVLPTIRSRVSLLRLPDLAAADVARVVGTLGPPWSELPAAAVADAARLGGGSVREALRRLGDGGGERGRRLRGLLDALPDIDWRALHVLADGLQGRDGDANLQILLDAAREWLTARVRDDAVGSRSDEPGRDEPGRHGSARGGQGGASALAPYAEAWARVAAAAGEAEALNLDRRSLAFAIVNELADAARRAQAPPPRR